MSAEPALFVVEDDPEVRASLSFWLEAEGYRVQTYPSAAALLGASIAPDGLLIIDEHLPDAFGSDIVRQIRSRGLALPAILITTSPSRALRSFCKTAGVPIVEKPLISDELVSAIRTAFGAVS